MKGFACLLLLVVSVQWAPCVIAASSSDPSTVISESVTKARLDELRAKAEAGDVDATLQLIGMYMKGDGVPQDDAEAFKWMRKVAERGLSGAQYGLGLMYYSGKGAPIDKAEAVKWFLKAAEQGHAKSEVQLGLMYLSGEGVTLDEGEALKWFRRAADQGDVSGEYQVGLFYEFNTDLKGAFEACKWYRKAAEQGLSVAQMWYGSHLLVGYGVPKDRDAAVKWIRKAADQGQADAEAWIGRFYDRGDGVPTDKGEAIKWFRKAAEQGAMYAQYELGLHYYLGDDVPKDPIEAFKWMRKAAEQGYTKAESQVAFFYAQGFGVTKDQVEALRWSRKAAEHGNVQAQILLAVMYAAGDGVPLDKIEALAWFNVAAASGDNDALNYRDRLERALGDTAKLTAQKRSDILVREIASIKAGHAGSVSLPPDDMSEKRTPKSCGSGAIVSVQGYILTAAHVVTGATQIMVVTPQGSRRASVQQIDEANDIAVLKIEGGPYLPLPVAPSRGVRLGQAVATIGFPNVAIQGFSPKVTRGEISSLNGVGDDPRCWQVSAPVQPGNSGGPLLDERGNLVGIVVSKLGTRAAKVTGDTPQNVNYAVKSAYALALLEPYLNSDAPEPNQANLSPRFEDMVAKAQQSVVLILVY